MAPKRRYQPVKAGDTGTSQTSDKEELVKARATKRAERVKARYEEAEKHKEAVRIIVFASISGNLKTRCSYCRETCTFARASTNRLSKNTIWL